jgi:long-subunit fatty acid transport protein
MSSEAILERSKRSSARRIERASRDLATFLLTWGLLAGAASAGDLYTNEFATPSMGVASAGAQAAAEDASTAFHNPAGMTRLGSIG